MSPTHHRNVAIAVLRAAVGLVFIVSGYAKLLQPQAEFLAVVKSFQAVPPSMAGVSALVIPWAEFLGGVFLLLGLWTRAALGAVWTLNTLFIGAIASALIRKLPIEDCGCFGESLSLPLPRMLILDGVIWLVCLILFRSGRPSSYSLDRWFLSKAH